MPTRAASLQRLIEMSLDNLDKKNSDIYEPVNETINENDFIDILCAISIQIQEAMLNNIESFWNLTTWKLRKKS